MSLSSKELAKILREELRDIEDATPDNLNHPVSGRILFISLASLLHKIATRLEGMED